LPRAPLPGVRGAAPAEAGDSAERVKPKAAHALRVAVLYNDDAERLEIGEAQDRIAVASAKWAAEAIARALVDVGREVRQVPVRGDAALVARGLERGGFDVVFNVCEGFAGRSRLEAHVASLLELLGLPYTGSPPLALALCQDKVRAKAVLAASGVRVADGAALSSAVGPLPAALRYPVIVKTRFEDASHGIADASVCADEAALRARAAYLIERYRQDAIVEAFLPGREFNVSVLGNDPPLVLPLSEIDFSGLPAGAPPLVTYEAKWVPESVYYEKTPVRCPARVEPGLRARVEATALAAYEALGCRDYARIDVRLDAAGEPVVLEVNPNPDISPTGGLVTTAKSPIGPDDGCPHWRPLAYERLIERILGFAIERGAGSAPGPRRRPARAARGPARD